MDHNAIMQEMIEKHESCRVIKDDFCYNVKLRPIAVSESLNGKLSTEDISTGMSIVRHQLSISNLKTNLYRGCDNINCKAANECIFRAVPNGDTNANIMFLNKMPTDYETCNMSSLCDRNGVLLSLILNKMNIPRESVYCTDMIKCNAQLDECSFNECINSYLNKEIEYVKPRVIVCNGLPVLKACIESKVLNNLPSNVTYGNIYDANTALNLPVKVIAIYDLNKVLQKTGDDYEKCKNELWMQLLSAVKASV